MIEVFITNIRRKTQAKEITQKLTGNFPQLKINIDLNDSERPFPCGHSIIRVEGAVIHAQGIISIVNQSGFNCAVLEDKICNNKQEMP